MADDVKSLTAELVRDPSSMVFLRLGELLRTEGQLDAARKVALTGLERHPEAVHAHDLYARILVDANDLDHAQRVWEALLQIDGRHQGAHKGLGFLHYSKGDLDRALDHLELALAADPTNQSVVQALHAVRNVAEAVSAEEPEDAFLGFEGQDRGLLLADRQGRALAGRLVTEDGVEALRRLSTASTLGWRGDLFANVPTGPAPAGLLLLALVLKRSTQYVNR